MKLLLLCILFVSCASCIDQNGGDGPRVKVYVSKPDQGGLVRSQESELILFNDTLDFRCLDKQDFDLLIRYCYDPQNEVVDDIRTKTKTMSRRKRKKYLTALVREIDRLLIEQDYDQNNKIKEYAEELSDESRK